MNTKKTSPIANDDIAIIGMACRVPHADTVEEFWQQLLAGRELIDDLSIEKLLDAGLKKDLVMNPNYVRRAGIINHIDQFAANFFSITPHDATLMDPQHRLFLELSYQVLEQTAYHADYRKHHSNSIGVYTTCSPNNYLLENILPNYAHVDSLTRYNLLLLNQPDMLPTRVAYKLNLSGPAFNIQANCSSSLVAVHVACQGLLQEDCAIAIAGGVSLQVPEKQGYLYMPGMILSHDGHCRAFDLAADGTVPGSGLGTVVLKKATQATADGDFIYAIIKSSAINNDGSAKVGFNAPSISGQRDVILAACSRAKINPRDIRYVEAHGTATKLGDPIEVQALTQAYRHFTQDKQYCALGSVKTNLGHTDTAAGIIGLIKTALVLYHQKIPASLHFQRENKHIQFSETPFYVNTHLKSWPDTLVQPLAAVSSFGIGGTNAHAILQAVPTEIALMNREPSPLKNLPRESYWLPPPKQDEYRKIKSSTKPMENTLNTLKTIWKNCLGVVDVDSEENFFTLGGDSFTALILINTVNQKFLINLPEDSLLLAPTLRQFVTLVNDKINNDTPSKLPQYCVKLRKLNHTTINLFFLHPVGGTVYCYQPLADALPKKYAAYGLQDPGLSNPKNALPSIEDMAKAYLEHIQKIQPQGPYYLLGASFGGYVAYEIAHLLLAQGELVKQLALIDTPGPQHLPQLLNSEQEIIDYLLDISGSLLNKKDLANKSKNEIISSILTHIDLIPPGFEKTMHHIFDTFKHNMTLMYAYQPNSLNLKLLFFKAKEKNPYMPADLEKSWLPLLPQGMRVIETPGNHLSMLLADNVKLIADSIVLFT